MIEDEDDTDEACLDTTIRHRSKLLTNIRYCSAKSTGIYIHLYKKFKKEKCTPCFVFLAKSSNINNSIRINKIVID